MSDATFVLSTGRCGTQWLTEVLRTSLGARARVEHEPLHSDYAPRQMLGAADPSSIGGRRAKRMLDHVSAIDRELESRNYIETGHPSWGALPWLLRRFAGRIRIVHLVRHPVATACSWLSHRAFVPPPVPILPIKELIAPTDAGVALPEYASSWSALTPYEKCLVYWAEVNALGLRLEQTANVPWLRISYEALFDPTKAALAATLAFLGADGNTAGSINRGEQIDQYRFAIESWPDLALIERHPRIIEIARDLGFDATKVNSLALSSRFGISPGAHA